jgi:hypothetical protein
VKTFYSLEDIEDLVAQGVRELIVDEDSVLTDVARDAAVRMGLKLVRKTRGLAASEGPPPAARATPGVGARPRGCQHGPLGGHDREETAPGQARTRPDGPSGNLVDDLVDAVKKMASKGSAG